MKRTRTPSPRAARFALGLTLDELAILLGYEGAQRRSQMHRIEIGERPLRPAQKRLLQAYLDGYRPHDWPHHNGGE
jgi:transcriptional regulator with XRE-family HTH domain